MKRMDLNLKRSELNKFKKVAITVLGLFLSFSGFSQGSWVGTTCPGGGECPYVIARGTTVVFRTTIPWGIGTYPAMQNVGVAYNSGGYKRYSVTYNTNGSYEVYVKQSSGDGAHYQSTIYTVADPVGDVALTPNPGNSSLPCSTSASFSASASNATIYGWSVTPTSPISPVTSISGSASANLTVNWNTSFSGTATIKVVAASAVGVSKEAQINISRSALTTFAPTNIILPSSPGAICYGQTVGLSARSYTVPANTFHLATFEWKIDDVLPFVQTNTGVNSSSYSPSAFVVDNANTISVRITPDPSVQCLVTYSSITKIISGSRGISPVIGIKPYVEVASVSWDGNATNDRCQGAGVSQFTASISNMEPPTAYQWTISVLSNPANVTVGTISMTTGQVIWNPNFYGLANITCTAYGCGGSVASNGKIVTVKKLPTIFNLTGPTQLCATASGLLQLSGSEAGVTYDLYREMTIYYPVTHFEWKKIAGGSGTSWSLPVAATVLEGEGQFNYESNGKYYVKASLPNGCPSLDTQPFTVGLIPKGIIAITSPNGFVGCDGSVKTLTATGGTDYEWYWDRNGLPGCPSRNPNENAQNCYPRIEDYGQPNQINFYFQIPLTYPKIYLQAKDNVCHEWTRTGSQQLLAIPGLELKKITPFMNFRCQGGGTTQFSIGYSGDPLSLQWTLSKGAGTIANPQASIALVTWNEGFTGATTLKITGTGCNGPTYLSQSIEVYPALDTEENRVRAFTAQESMDTPSQLSSQMFDKTKVNTITNFFDGLGRPVQNVNHYASPAGSDIVELKQYDQYGRESVKYLPFVASTNFSYNSLAVQNQLNYYSSSPSGKITQDIAPFALTQYEASPVNKVLKQGAPGQAWQPVDANPYNLNDHTVTKAYDFNNASEIIFFTYDRPTGQFTAKENNVIKYFPANALSVTITSDESRKEVIEYTDKQGRVVCKKVQVSGSGASKVYASTYYVYDDLGNLAVVLPPEAVTRFAQP